MVPEDPVSEREERDMKKLRMVVMKEEQATEIKMGSLGSNECWMWSLNLESSRGPASVRLMTESILQMLHIMRDIVPTVPPVDVNKLLPHRQGSRVQVQDGGLEGSKQKGISAKVSGPIKCRLWIQASACTASKLRVAPTLPFACYCLSTLLGHCCFSQAREEVIFSVVSLLLPPA